VKDERIKALKEMMDKVKEIQNSYIAGSSGWSLLQAAWGPLMVMHHLETETVFSDQTIGAIAKDE
jgi:hypothetical protein